MGSEEVYVLNGKVFRDSDAYGKYINDVVEENYEQIYKYIPKLSEESITSVNLKGYKCRLTVTKWHRITLVIEIESFLEHYKTLYPYYSIECNIGELVSLLDQSEYILVNLTSDPYFIQAKNKYWLRQRVLFVVDLESYLKLLSNYKI